MDWENIVKLSTVPRLIHRFNAIPITISTRCFVDTCKVNLNFI